MTDVKNQAKLYGKIMKVLSSVEKITKSGYNKHQKYHYATENDLIEAVKSLLIQHDLLILSSSEVTDVVKVIKNDKETLVTFVKTTHKFIDVETGAFEEVTSSGSGWDDTDKGTFKSITGAMKYFLSKNFLIASDDDPENDGTTTKKPANPSSFTNKGPKSSAAKSNAGFGGKKPETKKSGFGVSTEKTEPAPSFGNNTEVEAEPTVASVPEEPKQRVRF